jgi:hypothetical protein
VALFSKNKPTEKVNFEGGYVELQHLSKGVKDEYQNRMARLMKDLGAVDAKQLKGMTEDDIPTDIDFGSLLKQVSEAEYYKLSKAIKAWSEGVEITEKTVQDIDEELFDKISSKIDEMNELKESDKKN